MDAGKALPVVVEKEMGLTRKELSDGLVDLFDGAAQVLQDGGVKFEYDGKRVEIQLGTERSRQLGPSVNLPITPARLLFYGFTDEERDDFIRRFNLQFMKGGG